MIRPVSGWCTESDRSKGDVCLLFFRPVEATGLFLRSANEKTIDKFSTGLIILFSTVIEEKNERKAFEIGPNAHFYLDENVVWDLHFIIFFDICSMFLVNSISCPVEDGTAAPGNPVHPILYNRPDNRCPGNSPHSCSSMSPISDLV